MLCPSGTTRLIRPHALVPGLRSEAAEAAAEAAEAHAVAAEAEARRRLLHRLEGLLARLHLQPLLLRHRRRLRDAHLLGRLLGLDAGLELGPLLVDGRELLVALGVDLRLHHRKLRVLL